MNLMTSPLRKVASVAASATILATSFTAVAPAIVHTVTNAASTCVLEQGSTTVYPALVHANANINTLLGCDMTTVANGSGTGKGRLIDWFNSVSGAPQVDMAASSSPISSSAITGSAGTPGLGQVETANLMGFQVGGDGMVIVVRDDNPMTQITMAQVTGIYNGNYTVYTDLGANANGKTGTIIARARIPGSGTRDDMNRLFKMDRGVTLATAPYTKVSCSSGFTKCEPDVIDALGLPRFTTSQEEGDAVCASNSAIAYTSLANLQVYGPGTTACNTVPGGSGHTIKALALQSCSYSGFSGATDPATLTCSGSYVMPTTSSAAVGGAYPAKRALFLALPLVTKMAAKYGTGNGTGWTDNLNLTKAMDAVNYMASAAGQGHVSAVNFIPIAVAAKSPIPDADIDLSGDIGLTDIGQITGRWNRTDTIVGSVRADVNNDGGVGLLDVGQITGQWGAVGFVAP
jgi:ABC-type phosphate transport system substrate-binding protein